MTPVNNHEHDNPPSCFAVLEIVFPLGKDGLRHSPDTCIRCELKTRCLKTAMQKPEALKVADEKVDRAYKSQTIGFLERWAKKKSLAKKMKNQEKS